MKKLPMVQGKEILKQALESAKNAQSEKYIKKVRNLILAKQAFQNAIEEIDGILKSLEENDAMVYERIEKVNKFCERIKSVVFDRSYEVSSFMRYRDEEENDF